MTQPFQLSGFFFGHFFLMSSDRDGGFNKVRRRERPLEISVKFFYWKRKLTGTRDLQGKADVENTGALVKLHYQKRQR